MRLAILDDYEKVARDLAPWESLGPDIKIDVYHDRVVIEDALVDRLLPYDILVIMRERTPFPQRLIERLANLKLLVTSGRVNRAIDLAACQKNGVVVCGTESSKNAPAELAWGLILSLARRIPQQDRAVRQGIWGEGIGTALEGKVLGILGLGNLGTQVARVGLAFGMQVIAWSQNLTQQRAAAVGAVWVKKDDLFANSDIISIHIVLSHRTRGLIGAHEIGLMKPSACIVNTSRGPIVQEAVLIEALSKGRIAGAGLDVFDDEPLSPDHPYVSLPNTVLTPHIGYVTKESFRTYFNQALEDVVAWLAGKPVRVIKPAPESSVG
jgi:phosphoglycerate dehydrogenase-like enzyme